MAITQTAIGRVLPSYKGNWNSFEIYKKLDSVLYDGSSYIALQDTTGTVPGTVPSIWQKTSSKGDSGEINSVTALAYAAPSAEVSVSTSGDPSNIDLSFVFGLPQGEQGEPAQFSTVVANASSVAWNVPASARVDISGPPSSATISFDFDIPRAQGEGISLVDGLGASGSEGNVLLTAVQYGRPQSDLQANPSWQGQARQNINAQIAGDYVVSPQSKTVNYFLQYLGNNEWTTSKVEVFPESGEVGYYLRKTSNATEWAPVQALPSGGAMGMPLVKSSVADYAVTWGSFITDAEIDAIIDS